MKKQVIRGICCSLLLMVSGPQIFTESPLIISAARAQTLPHNTVVALRGNIVFGLGGDRYVFRDLSGDLVVKIDDDTWGMEVGPYDRIAIDGSLKRNDRIGQIELDVSVIRRAVGAPERGAQELEYLFIWPVTGRLTSPYGNRRSPLTGRRQFHTGIDISAPAGTPVRSAMSGRVITVSRDRVYGNYIVINHHSGFRTKYAHLSAASVRAGDYVETGQRIGDVGSTGLSTGPHLHFGVFINGATVNPRRFLR